jgi:DNA-directed RNA polymerase specialized sigma24 family protein
MRPLCLASSTQVQPAIEDLPQHVAGLRRYALALTGSRYEAEDLVQELLAIATELGAEEPRSPLSRRLLRATTGRCTAGAAHLLLGCERHGAC